MKKLAWSAGLIIVGSIAPAISGCVVTLNGSDDGGTFVQDSGGYDSTASDTGVQAADTGGPVDSNPGNDADAMTDAFVCPVGVQTGKPACNQCIESACCAQWVTCTTPDDAGVDDAGSSACVQLTNCVQDWVASDAGTLADGETVCGTSYSPSERAASHDFLTCKRNSCVMQCGG